MRSELVRLDAYERLPESRLDPMVFRRCVGICSTAK